MFLDRRLELTCATVYLLPFRSQGPDPLYITQDGTSAPCTGHETFYGYLGRVAISTNAALMAYFDGVSPGGSPSRAAYIGRLTSWEMLGPLVSFRTGKGRDGKPLL